MSFLIAFFLIFTWGYAFIDLVLIWGRERERERETWIWERNISWLPLIRALAWDGTCNIWCTGRRSNQLSNPTRAAKFRFMKGHISALLWALPQPKTSCSYRPMKRIHPTKEELSLFHPGIKIDLLQEAQVSFSKALPWAKKHGLLLLTVNGIILTVKRSGVEKNNGFRASQLQW